MKYTNKNGEKKRSLAIFIDEDIYDRFKKIAKERYSTMTVFGQQVIADFVSSYEEDKKKKK